MKLDMDDLFSVAEIKDLNLCEVASVSAGIAPTQYLSGLANGNNNSGGAISSALAALLGAARSGCSNLKSVV